MSLVMILILEKPAVCYPKRYSIVKADYENLKNTVIMFRDMIENCDKPTIPKDDLLADIAMFF